MAEESEVVVAGEVVAEVMERETGAEAAADEPRGRLSSLFGLRRESGAEASEAGTEQAAGEAVGTVEFLGIWNEVGLDGASRDTRGLLDSLCVRIERGAPFAHDRAMPIKSKVWGDSRAHIHAFRVAFSRLVDELVQEKAPSGIFAASQWTEIGDGDASDYWGFSWAASPDDVSYQRHGFVGMESDQRENIRFADFEGVVDDLGKYDQNIMAVYRVTLPRGGLAADKWAGRPPPPAPKELYTGPRDDGLLSTEEISGGYYSGCRSPFECCSSMTVVPLGADVIETRRSACFFFPCALGLIGPLADTEVRTRNPGTNAFDGMTFSADGTAKPRDCGGYKKRPDSQKRAFQKVDARDLAGKWCGCCCLPFVPLWPFSHIFCTTKKALNQDQYADEPGLRCLLCLPFPYCGGGTRTRRFVNGHATNGFAKDAGDPNDVHWYREPGYAAGGPVFFAKKFG